MFRPALLCLVVLATAPAHAADPLPLYKAGIAAKKTGDLVAAEKQFRACLAADGKYARCHFSLGVLLKKRDVLDEAEQHFRAALETAPTWGQCRFSLGMTLLKKGDNDGARVAFEAAIADKDLEPEDRAESWNALGVMHRQADRLKEAVAAYDQAIAAKPRAAFHQNKAIALERLADFVGSEAASRAAIALDVNDPSSWTLLARSLDAQKRPTDAVAAWQKVTELAPNGAEGWYGLGSAAEDAGNKVVARAGFEAYLRLAPAEANRDAIRARIDKMR